MRGTDKTRILVTFENDYRAYADALVSATTAARPHLEVALLVGVEALQTEVQRLDPHLVICSSSNPAAAGQEEEEQEGRLLSWVELSVNPQRPSKFCVDGQRWESSNPSLKEVLGVIEETEQLLDSNWRPALGDVLRPTNP